MRTIIELPREQLTSLAQLCEKEKISRAEAIRRAVGQLLATQRSAKADVGFGAWRHRRGDARRMVDRVRAEWERK